MDRKQQARFVEKIVVVDASSSTPLVPGYGGGPDFTPTAVLGWLSPSNCSALEKVVSKCNKMEITILIAIEHIICCLVSAL